eukprot:2492672-Rhodomonas_salina.1
MPKSVGLALRREPGMACSLSSLWLFITMRAAPPSKSKSSWYVSARPSTPNSLSSPSPSLYANPAPSKALVCPFSSTLSLTLPSVQTTTSSALLSPAACTAQLQ